ncbi:MAG: beta-lactamase family protein [Planctomycetes bacterium]|nr:beta-lactamase family protein [Planctomycetota bacterium]
MLKRRPFILSVTAGTLLTMDRKVFARDWNSVSNILEQAVANHILRAASVHLRIEDEIFQQHYGAATSSRSAFLLGSITKPMAIAAVMKLYDQGVFQLDDPAVKFLPEFTGEGRDQITIRHLLTHTSGLPDQLPDNDQQRRSHASLQQFAARAMQLKPRFQPGSAYEYSSMGILLACEIASRHTKQNIPELVEATVLQPLKMEHSCLGRKKLARQDIVAVQTEFAAPEAGGGDPTAKNWDWNSDYWRDLGAPWGGMHASASDVATFLDTFLKHDGKILRPETSRLMIRNHNPETLPSRGLGFDTGFEEFGMPPGSSIFGHTGSTGTIAWADPGTHSICVILTSLPGAAMKEHPRLLASQAFATLR